MADFQYTKGENKRASLKRYIKVNKSGNINFNHRRLKNVLEGKNDNDVVTLKQLYDDREKIEDLYKIFDSLAGTLNNYEDELTHLRNNLQNMNIVAQYNDLDEKIKQNKEALTNQTVDISKNKAEVGRELLDLYKRITTISEMLAKHFVFIEQHKDIKTDIAAQVEGVHNQLMEDLGFMNDILETQGLKIRENENDIGQVNWLVNDKESLAKTLELKKVLQTVPTFKGQHVSSINVATRELMESMDTDILDVLPDNNIVKFRNTRTNFDDFSDLVEYNPDGSFTFKQMCFATIFVYVKEISSINDTIDKFNLNLNIYENKTESNKIIQFFDKGNEFTGDEYQSIVVVFHPGDKLWLSEFIKFDADNEQSNSSLSWYYKLTIEDYHLFDIEK
jgi:hypothetical protein